MLTFIVIAYIVTAYFIVDFGLLFKLSLKTVSWVYQIDRNH